ncbi:hypothetical protein G6F68_017919 [Rhizopus microsporus]|uniref:Uncharacterized protein n=1 Tax=Rhizopus delemar TaxID=936053 RepID=A0A9P6XLW1_9FUNG|nr:hypothetical protein G6F68_017919 [Rhizopus microsporus]KAG1523815.1 hypothetical protein G6F50_018579 [Rhizopus delemar]
MRSLPQKREATRAGLRGALAQLEQEHVELLARGAEAGPVGDHGPTSAEYPAARRPSGSWPAGAQSCHRLH